MSDWWSRVASSLGLDAKECDVTPYQLLHADEVFLTGTHAGIVPVTSVDAQAVGAGAPGPCTP